MRVINEIDKDEPGKSTPLIPYDKINIKIMSDSICIYIEADIKDSLFELLFICIDFQVRMIERNPPILLRGAITKGKLLSEGDLLYGPGFVDAYLMEENNAAVPRIIINKCIVDDYIARFSTNHIPSNILMKDYDAFYCTNYISFYGMTDRTKIAKYDVLYRHIQDILSSTTDDSIRNKYLYLESKVQPFIKE